MKELKDYIHLYPLCDCTYDTVEQKGVIGKNTFKIMERVMLGKDNFYYPQNLQLRLRHITDMTDDEVKEMDRIVDTYDSERMSDAIEGMAEATNYLRNRFIDVDGLIDAGFAIDSTI